MTVWRIEVTRTSSEVFYVEASSAQMARDLGEELSDRSEASVDDRDLTVVACKPDDVPSLFNIFKDGRWVSPRKVVS